VPEEYASVVNGIEAALIGGLVGALIVSTIGVVVDWQRAHRNADESQKQRAHELEVLVLEQYHQMQQAAMQDAARVRDARLSRLNEDARELARALFDLERLALLMQWGRAADSAEMDRLEMSAHSHFESARAGLTLDPEGAALSATFESLTQEIAQYQSMIQSHRVLVEARAVEQVVDHADQLEVQRAKVVEGIKAAVSETQRVLKSAAVPIEAPRAPVQLSRTAGGESAMPLAAPSMELIPGQP
jgi:hypothetical protein